MMMLAHNLLSLESFPIAHCFSCLDCVSVFEGELHISHTDQLVCSGVYSPLIQGFKLHGEGERVRVTRANFLF